MKIKELFGFKGKNVVITGAGSGMGYAAAKLLVQLGANVYATVRRKLRHPPFSRHPKRKDIFRFHRIAHYFVFSFRQSMRHNNILLESGNHWTDGVVDGCKIFQHIQIQQHELHHVF